MTRTSLLLTAALAASACTGVASPVTEARDDGLRLTATRLATNDTRTAADDEEALAVGTATAAGDGTATAGDTRDPDGTATGDPAGDVTHGGPGGLPPAPPSKDYDAGPAAPWNARPVVYRDLVADVDGATYGAEWARLRDLHFHPTVLNAQNDGGALRFSGLWHKDAGVIDWASRRGLTEAEYLAEWGARDAAGFRLLDLDVHVSGGRPAFHAIWVKEAQPKGYMSHRNLSRVQLGVKVGEYEALGYRPTRITAYPAGDDLRYAAVWVKDGRTDFAYHVDLDGPTYGQLWSLYRDQGYMPVDVSAYQQEGEQRFAAVWLREDSTVDGWASNSALTADELAELNEDRTKRNLVLVDLDGYVTPEGDTRFSAIWHRPKARRVISSNLSTAQDGDIAAMRGVIDGYEFDGGDGRQGSLGFFVQDLQTGDFVAYNMHEPFYLASTSKVLIGARVAAHPGIDPADTVNFDSTMWRGEASRGFTQADLNTDVSVATFMANMIQGSDTASTDYLHGLIAQLDGATGLQDWLKDSVGLQNVGEITDICAVDQRISAFTDTCVFDVSCDTYEAFRRGGTNAWNATAAEQACLANLAGHTSLANHDAYYTTQANTMTPAAYGKFFWKLAQGDLMTNADRAELLQALDGGWANSFNIDEGVLYDEFGTKNGGKRRVSTQVVFLWDWNGADGDHTDITPRYAAVLMTEDWSFDDGNDADLNNVNDDTQYARDAMRGVLAEALDFLQ